MKKRVLTGIQASGDFHVGNYFGAIKQMVDLQNNPDTELFVFVADLHAFTSHPESKVFKQNLKNAVIDWLSLGIDPEKVVFYRQSDIPAHTEMFWYLLNHTPMGLLERAHSYKDKKANGVDANAGLFTYPVLMAADILLYDADIVPVGKDQKQHVEMARDIAQKFDYAYGSQIFTLPEAKIEANVQTVPGLDGRKMSKSYGNTIPVFCSKSELKKKVMSIKTESLNLGEPMNPETCQVFAFHKLFANPRLAELEQEYRAGSIGFGDSKKELLELIWDYFADARAKKEFFEANPQAVEKILQTGTKTARFLANKKLWKVRKKIGLPEKHLDE
ncbi:tryptophan--tRNA ligase [bacterium DOLZORAL124_38_8]|nr:MAG: tryptophan--tRNA ligase [bacterium DOLZORAL124_38_8]